MGSLTAGETISGGLGSPAARWVFVGVWLCGVWLGFVADVLYPLDPLNASAYLAALAAALLLTTPGAAPLSPAQATALVVLTGYTATVVLIQTPVVGGSLELNFCLFLTAFAIPRGNWVAGGVASAGLIGAAAAWGMFQGGTALQMVDLLAVPTGTLAAAVAWRLVLDRIVTQELEIRSKGALSKERIAASELALEASRKELSEIRAGVSPLLEALVAGKPVDEQTRQDLIRAEATTRDRILAPHLQHPNLTNAISELRRRGVTVVLLGEPDITRRVSDDVAAALAGLISGVEQGRVTLRTLPPDRRAAFSVVIRQEDRTTNLLLSASGRVTSRT